jgi:hypothetical protein
MCGFTDVPSQSPTTIYSTKTLNPNGNTAGANTGTSGGAGGLSRSDKIALGVGLSVPLLALIVSSWKCLQKRRSDRGA